MDVKTQMSGLTMSASLLISPKSDMPISMTAASCSSLSDRTVRGTPSSLLRFAGVFSVRNLRDSTLAVSSLAVVLPTLPTMPTTGILKSFL